MRLLMFLLVLNLGLKAWSDSPPPKIDVISQLLKINSSKWDASKKAEGLLEAKALWEYLQDHRLCNKTCPDFPLQIDEKGFETIKPIPNGAVSGIFGKLAAAREFAVASNEDQTVRSPKSRLGQALDFARSKRVQYNLGTSKSIVTENQTGAAGFQSEARP